jgi:hypothetical protein
MPEPLDNAQTKLINDITVTGDADQTATRVKNLKTFAEARKLLDPDPIPDPEPTGPKAFFERHAGDFIKVGGTLIVVAVIAVVESKGDVIFRSKASKFI